MLSSRTGQQAQSRGGELGPDGCSAPSLIGTKNAKGRGLLHAQIPFHGPAAARPVAGGLVNTVPGTPLPGLRPGPAPQQLEEGQPHSQVANSHQPRCPLTWPVPAAAFLPRVMFPGIMTCGLHAGSGEAQPPGWAVHPPRHPPSTGLHRLASGCLEGQGWGSEAWRCAGRSHPVVLPGLGEPPAQAALCCPVEGCPYPLASPPASQPSLVPGFAHR